MRKILGYATFVDPEQPLVERDSVNCCHCGRIIFVKPGTASTVYLLFDPARWRWVEEPGASCWHCMQPVCLACHEKGSCVPLERLLERLEAPRAGA